MTKRTCTWTLVVVAVMAFFLATGVLLNAVACFIEGTAYPFITLLICIFLPLPLLAAEKTDDVLYFITGVMGTSAIALPLLLAHHQIVSIPGSYLTISGAWSALLVLILFVGMIKRKNNNSHTYE